METQVAVEQTEQVEKPKPVVRPLQVEFDLEKLELLDIVLINDVVMGNPYPLVDAIQLLDRVVVGGLKGRSLSQYRPLLGRLVAIVNEIVNPKSEG